MKLEEIELRMNHLTHPWPIKNAEGETIAVTSFIDIAEMYIPKLIAVAKAAKDIPYKLYPVLNGALKELEK